MMSETGGEGRKMEQNDCGDLEEICVIENKETARK